jgi:hypothetical protein
MRTGAFRYCYEKKKILSLGFIGTGFNGFGFLFHQDIGSYQRGQFSKRES